MTEARCRMKDRLGATAGKSVPAGLSDRQHGSTSNDLLFDLGDST
jgi:hypothetical protein